MQDWEKHLSVIMINNQYYVLERYNVGNWIGLSGQMCITFLETRVIQSMSTLVPFGISELR